LVLDGDDAEAALGALTEELTPYVSQTPASGAAN